MAQMLVEILLGGMGVPFKRNPGGMPIVDGYEIAGVTFSEVFRVEGFTAYQRIKDGWLSVGEWDHKPTLEEIGERIKK